MELEPDAGTPERLVAACGARTVWWLTLKGRTQPTAVPGAQSLVGRGSA